MRDKVYNYKLAKGAGLIDETLSLLSIFEKGMTKEYLAQIVHDTNILSKCTDKRSMDIVKIVFYPRYMKRNPNVPFWLKSIREKGLMLPQFKQLLMLYSMRDNAVVYDYVQKELKVPTDIICGDVPAKARVDIVSRFQGGAVKVLLCQTQACKEGLTLDTADVSIFLDTYPPCADYLQARDRMIATTPERNKPKEIIHVMMQGTYDEKMYRLVDKNIDEASLINDYKKYITERRHAQ